MIKKELAGYSRVPGSSDQKTDFGRFGYHPRVAKKFFMHDLGRNRAENLNRAKIVLLKCSNIGLKGS